MATLRLGESDGAPVLTVENTEAGLDSILTIENVINGGTKENVSTVEQDVVQKIQNFIDGETNNE